MHGLGLLGAVDRAEAAFADLLVHGVRAEVLSRLEAHVISKRAAVPPQQPEILLQDSNRPSSGKGDQLCHVRVQCHQLPIEVG